MRKIVRVETVVETITDDKSSYTSTEEDTETEYQHNINQDNQQLPEQYYIQSNSQYT